jgi:GNAT superfamily N-acetyltransferase
MSSIQTPAVCLISGRHFYKHRFAFLRASSTINPSQGGNTMECIVLSWGQVTEEDTKDINKLLGRSTEADSISCSRINLIAAQNILMVVRDEMTRIKGVATLSVICLMTGNVGYIDDVVIDRSLRRKGVRRELVESLIATAERYNVVRLIIPSDSESVSAHRLYWRLGFELLHRCYILRP